jgi:hypothetical protein
LVVTPGFEEREPLGPSHKSCSNPERVRQELSLKVVYERIKGGVFLMSLFDEPSTLLLRRNTPWRKIT